MALSPSFLSEASRWIRADTVTHRSNGALVSRAEALLRRRGFSARRQKVVERGVPFYNLLARRGPAGGRPLLLNTHTDTVPPGPSARWDSDPFRLARRGGFLHGLGVADVKLNLLCQIEALAGMEGQDFRRPVLISATYGEERGLEGARRLISGWRGPKPALALIGEPSELAVVHRHRGYLVFEWALPEGPLLRGRGAVPGFEATLRGKSAHSSTPHLGVNALERGIDLFSTLARGGLPPRVVGAEGGTAHNQVPAEARFTFLLPAAPRVKDAEVRPVRVPLRRPLRLFPWELLPRLKALSASLPATHTLNWALLSGENGRWRARFDLRFPPEDDSARLVALARKALSGAGEVSVVLDDPALDAPRRGPVVSLVTKALRGAGLPARLQEKLTCTEAGLFHAWGVPAVVIGPGRSTGNVHRPNERISAAQLAAAVRFYRRLLQLWTTS